MPISPSKLVGLKFDFNDAVTLDRQLSNTARRVSWLLLSRYLNGKTLEAWPSVPKIAKDLDVSESTVWRCIGKLCQSGYWTKRPGGGRSNSNRYRPNLETLASAPGFNAETLASVHLNPRTGAPKNLASVRGEPLEEPFKEPRNKISQNVGGKTKNQLARQEDGVNGENLCGMAPERLERALYYRRRERSSSIRFGEITDRERDAADAWLAEHPEGEGQ